MTTKFEAKNRVSPFGKFNLTSRTFGSRTCSAKVLYFHYKNQNLANPDGTGRKRDGSKSEKDVVSGILEAEISSLRVSKSLSSTSSFEIRLLPTKNFKQLISPGDWMLIYLHDTATTKAANDPKEMDSKNIVMIGNVDRVSKSFEKDKETDKTMLRFVVSGRGIEKVFENTDIWFNPFLQKEKELDVLMRDAGLETTGNPSTIVKLLIDIFLGKGANIGRSKTSDLSMWSIPQEMARILKSSGDARFYGILKQEIESDLPGYGARLMLAVNSNGSLMDLMKRYSNEIINQLYFEDVRDSDGYVYPTVVLRPRPVNTPAFEKRNPAQLKGKFKTLQKLAKENSVEILQSEIIYEDLGKDDHAKFNMWWLNAHNKLDSIMNGTENLKSYNPLIVSSSIKRDGLRRFEQTLDFSFIQDTKSSGLSDVDLVSAFADQLYDFHFANHLYDQGTIECTGVLEAELGKALIVKGNPAFPNAADKVYYIEGYEHTWNFPSTWRTTFTLTHGQWLDQQNIFIDIDESNGGKPDDMLTGSYIAQTVTSRS